MVPTIVQKLGSRAAVPGYPVTRDAADFGDTPYIQRLPDLGEESDLLMP